MNIVEILEPMFPEPLNVADFVIFGLFSKKSFCSSSFLGGGEWWWVHMNTDCIYPWKR